MGRTQKQLREDIRSEVSKQYRDKIAEQDRLIEFLKSKLVETGKENERLSKELRKAESNRKAREDILMRAVSLTSTALMLNKNT